MVRKIFNGRTIATAGPLPGQMTVENLKIWTRLRGGVFVEGCEEKLRAGMLLGDLNEAPTHLLCTEAQFNKLKKKPTFKQILTKHKRVHILHYDWYEFSCTENKKLPEREYSMRNVLAKERAAKRERDRVERGKREAEKFVNTNFFHVYFDREAFLHQVTITREGEDGEVERYEMTLWESNAKPNLYQFTAKYLKRKGCSQPSYYRPSPCAGKWKTEMDLFMNFFRIKTGIMWEDRVMLQGTTAAGWFQYQPPTGGKPVGRRLRLPYWECMEINARERGLPWPPVEVVEAGKPEDEDMPDAEENDGSDLEDNSEEVEVQGGREANDNEHANDMAMDSDNDVDSGVSVCDSILDCEQEDEDTLHAVVLANEDQGYQHKGPKNEIKSEGQGSEMEEGDSGVSIHESDTESKKIRRTISLAGYVHEHDPVEWKDAVKFIDHMNETLAAARERVLLADDAILNARDALPGYIQGYLFDY